MSDDIQAVQALIARLHDSIAKGDFETAHTCFYGSRFRFFGNQSGDPARWSAVGYFTEEEIRRWESSLPADVSYVNEIEFLRTDVRDNMGLVVTRETGSTSWGGSWEKRVNTWFAARIDGEWKILGSFHRDDSL